MKRAELQRAAFLNMEKDQVDLVQGLEAVVKRLVEVAERDS